MNIVVESVMFVAVKIGPGRKITKLGYSQVLSKIVDLAELHISTSKEKYVPNPHHPERTAWISSSTSICILSNSHVSGGVLGLISYGQASRFHRKPDPIVAEAALCEGLKIAATAVS